MTFISITSKKSKSCSSIYVLQTEMVIIDEDDNVKDENS